VHVDVRFGETRGDGAEEVRGDGEVEQAVQGTARAPFEAVELAGKGAVSGWIADVHVDYGQHFFEPRENFGIGVFVPAGSFFYERENVGYRRAAPRNAGDMEGIGQHAGFGEMEQRR